MNITEMASLLSKLGSIAIRVDSSCMMRVCATVLSDGTTLHTRFGFGAAVGGDIGRFPRDGRRHLFRGRVRCQTAALSGLRGARSADS